MMFFRWLWIGALVTASAGAQTPEMALVPAGEFWMGRTFFFLVDAIGYFERDRQDDFPAHRVKLDAFYIDRYEVRNSEYAKFMAAKGVKAPWHWPGGRIAAGEEDFPIYNVDWYQANDYCAWAGKRLPTEAEWEKAARGGLDRKRYTWGDEVAGKAPANVASKGPGAVGRFAANGYGIFDMTGNVWEWTNDWYERNYYSVSPVENPRGPEKGANKVMRGAGWIDVDERNYMPSFRNYTDPVERAMTIGFRCAKSIPQAR